MFSDRLPRDLAANRLASAVESLRSSGRTFIDLTASNPTKAGIEYPRGLLAPIADARALRYDPTPFGLLEARLAVAAEYRRHGLELTPGHVVLTASTSDSYSVLFKLLCGAGDEVLVPRPSYPLFEYLTRLDLVTPKPYALEYHGRWSLDFGSLERAITPRTRAVLVVSPNNPTGSLIARDELSRLSSICAEREIAIVADEVFVDFELEDGALARAGRPVAERDALTFSLGGLSKSVGLPQLKLGWIAVSGPPALVGEALQRLEVICDTYLSVSTPAQVGAADLLRDGTAVRDAIGRRLRANYAGLERMLSAAPACTRLNADAGWYAVLQVPSFEPEEELVLDLLGRDGVLIHPGYFFDFPRESFLVVSLLTPEAEFREGIGRVVERFREQGWIASVMTERAAGLIVPLFSCVSSRSWGIGEIPDLVPMAAWMREAGVRTWQLLPVNEMAPGEQSPYSAISAMAVDPIFIHVPDIADFQAIGGLAALSADDRRALSSIQQAASVDYRTARRLKHTWLRASFQRFLAVDWDRETSRASDLRAYAESQAWWLADYSLFRAIHAREGGAEWNGWPSELRDRTSLDAARRELANQILFFQYLQWIADGQWRAARRQAAQVRLFGDLPFMVDGDSADVWVRPHQFRMDATIGAPPDAFSAEGQDWGTPVYDWSVVTREDFEWLRKRARRCADLFDGFRVDHLVGFYRTYARPRDGRPAYFTPSDESSQRELGETVLRLFMDSGATIVAEDLGTVPDFVRESIARQGVPGFKVFRWERHWHTEGHPFRDPATYPSLSVALSGTHDTEPMIIWWEETTDDERRKVSAVTRSDIARAAYPEVRDVLIESLYASGSNLVMLPIQDVFGWRDRINDPSVMAESNWVYRLPWHVDRLDEFPEARERQAALRTFATRHGRV